MSWDKVKSCTVEIATQSGDIRGTGFFISKEGHLLTCAHVVEACGGPTEVRVCKQPVSLLYLGNSRCDDFAILQVVGYQGNAVSLSLAFQPMDRFLTIGFGRPDFPQGASIDGTITDINQQSSFGNLPMLRLRIKADAQRVQAGYSGAPVFDTENERVIGLIAAYDNTEGGLAIPLTTVLEKWSTLKNLLHPHPVMPPLESTANSAKVFISYRSSDPDLSLAQAFYEAIVGAGHQAFMAGESIRLGEDWPSRIDRELEQCDYFLLLLSPQSANSEMVTEEVRRAKQLRDGRENQRPAILPIRVGFPINSPLNYDLRGYLNRIQQREWRSFADTSAIVQEILCLLSENQAPALLDAASRLPTALPALETFEYPPLPIAEAELPEGQVDLASLFYVERPPIESRCYEAIVKPGALIRIKAPRQMGKTSLMARILHKAEQQSLTTVPLSFQLADEEVFSNLDRFLQWFCASISWQLDLPEKLADYWKNIVGSKFSCTNYFERYLLREISSPLALGLDEVDLILQHREIASNFFSLLRGWHEYAKNRELWKKLRLVVVHSTEVYIPLNINQSPFNVGLSIELPEFNQEQVQDLARRHKLNWNTDQVKHLMKMVGGHPYLVRVTFYGIAREDITLEQFLQQAPTEAGPYSDHLRRHWWNLTQRPELAAAFKKVVSANNPVELEPVLAFQLQSMGLVNLRGNNVTPRCDLYREYFRDRLRIG